MNILFVDLKEEELKTLMIAERQRITLNPNLDTRDNISLLDTNEELFQLNFLIGLFDNKEFIGFCIIPKYAKTILCRIYLKPEYRRLGIGSIAIKKLNIYQLSCLTTNLNALKFYESIGFKEVTRSKYFVDLKKDY